MERTVNLREKRKHMKVLKKAVPEFEEVDGDEEDGWVTLEHDNPPMELLKPLIRTAECMIDPTKPNSYHLKMPAARKLVAKMGGGWTVEGGAIVRALPYKFEMRFKLNNADEPAYGDQCRKELRKLMDQKMPADIEKDIDGIYLYDEAKPPDERKKRWLYVSVPQTAQVRQKTITFLGRAGARFHPERYLKGHEYYPERFPRNGIERGGMDIGFYGPQTIYVKFYMSGDWMADVLFTAIVDGWKRAMEFEGGNLKLDAWAKEAGGPLKKARADALANAVAQVEQLEHRISQAAEEILNDKLALELAQDQAEMYKKPIKAGDILKEYPALEHVQWVNTDDPVVLTLKTKDITLNGVNIGPYVIKINQPALNVSVMGTIAAPDGIVHPNIWAEGDKWHQDIDKEKLKALVTAIAAGEMHRAVDIVVGNLMVAPNEGAHKKRLDKLAKAIEEKRKKAEAKKAKAEVVAPVEPKVEEVAK